MCIVAPGKIIKINGRKATVQYPREQRDVLVGEENIKLGDMVLVQMGIVVSKLTSAEAKSALQAWKL
jgi:hydrogenase expression/formation protein HypC